MNIKEQLIALQKAMQAIVEGAKASNRELTNVEVADLEAKGAEALELKGKIERSERAKAMMDQIGGARQQRQPRRQRRLRRELPEPEGARVRLLDP